MLMTKGEMCAVMGDGKEVYEDLIKAIKAVHSAIAKAGSKEFADEFIVHAGRDAMNLNHEVIEIVNETIRRRDED